MDWQLQTETVMADLSDSKWNLVLQPLKTLNRHYHNTKLGRVVTYHKGLPLIKLGNPLITMVFLDHMAN